MRKVLRTAIFSRNSSVLSSPRSFFWFYQDCR